MTALTITNVGGVAIGLFSMLVLIAALPVIGWVERHDPLRPSPAVARVRRWLGRHQRTGGVR